MIYIYMTNMDTIILNNKWINNIKLIDSDISEENINININGNNINIISNFKEYCYIECFSKNIDKINLILLLTNNKSFLNILKIIDENLLNDTHHVYNDIFNFYNKFDEKTKIKINYEELYLVSKQQKNSNIQFNVSLIPKGLLLNQQQIYNLILNEIKIINSNFNYQHYIYPFENNIYDLRIKLFFNKEKINYLELKLVLDSKLYPFYPPKIEIIAPKIKLPLTMAIMNLNIFKLENWKSIISFEWLLLNIYQQLEPIIDGHLYIDTESYNIIEYLLISLSTFTKYIVSDISIIKLDFKKSEIIKDNEYWKSGVGYGYDKAPAWDINNFIKEKEINNFEIIKILLKISENIDKNNLKYINDSILYDYIINQTFGITLLDIQNNYLVFVEIFNILDILFNYICDINYDFIEKINKNLKEIKIEISVLFANLSNIPEIKLFTLINTIADNYNKIVLNKETDTVIYPDIIIEQYDDKKTYENYMKKLQINIINDLDPSHKFYDKKDIKNNSKSLTRVVTEISSFKSGVPLNYESTIWIRIPKNNINLLSFIISGPKDTPYQDGLFVFNTFLPANYPEKVPEILLVTTGKTTVRFNPNLYNSGKVCLSLLGTWPGDEGEKWNPKTSTFLQILVSIQSLIFVEDPYFNEPGYEKTINTEKGKIACQAYNEKIQLATMQWGIIDQITNPPFGFEEITIEHFKQKKKDILVKCKLWCDNSKNNEEFIKYYDILSELLAKI